MTRKAVMRSAGPAYEIVWTVAPSLSSAFSSSTSNGADESYS
jgi:hypothetical protein